MNNMNQDEPIEEGAADATDDDRVSGIVDQIKADLRLGAVTDVDAELLTRLTEAGVEVSEEEFVSIRATLDSDKA